MVAENPGGQGTFHCLSTARQCHVFQRFPPPLLGFGYSVSGQGDECLAKGDFQFLGLIGSERHVGVQSRPYGIEGVFERPKKFWEWERDLTLSANRRLRHATGDHQT